jgi:hypothetical protein
MHLCVCVCLVTTSSSFNLPGCFAGSETLIMESGETIGSKQYSHLQLYTSLTEAEVIENTGSRSSTGSSSGSVVVYE